MAFTPTALNLPQYPFRITLREKQHFIFDELRKKHLVLTPEEWVRQHFIQYLILEKKFPKSLIQLEAGLNLNQRIQRTDIVACSLVEHLLVDLYMWRLTFDDHYSLS